MSYKERSREANKWKYRIANILNFLLFIFSLASQMIGVAAVDGNPAVAIGLIIAGSLGLAFFADTLKYNSEYSEEE